MMERVRKEEVWLRYASWSLRSIRWDLGGVSAFLWEMISVFPISLSNLLNPATVRPFACHLAQICRSSQFSSSPSYFQEEAVSFTQYLGSFQAILHKNYQKIPTFAIRPADSSWQYLESPDLVWVCFVYVFETPWGWLIMICYNDDGGPRTMIHNQGSKRGTDCNLC